MICVLDVYQRFGRHTLVGPGLKLTAKTWHRIRPSMGVNARDTDPDQQRHQLFITHRRLATAIAHVTGATGNIIEYRTQPGMDQSRCCYKRGIECGIANGMYLFKRGREMRKSTLERS